MVLLGFTGFYWVLLGILQLNGVLLGFTEFYWVLLGFTRFYRVFPDFPGLYWVLPSCFGFLLGFSWFLPSFRSVWIVQGGLIYWFEVNCVLFQLHGCLGVRAWPWLGMLGMPLRVVAGQSVTFGSFFIFFYLIFSFLFCFFLDGGGGGSRKQKEKEKENLFFFNWLFFWNRLRPIRVVAAVPFEFPSLFFSLYSFPFSFSKATLS